VVRAEQGASQLRTALDAGVNPTRFWKLENGYAEPSAHEREAIAKALGTSPEAIWPPTLAENGEAEGHAVSAAACRGALCASDGGGLPFAVTVPRQVVR
jgi:transcriptional regulator with XRE-family HTH domain